jgi:hypothetical protein
MADAVQSTQVPAPPPQPLSALPATQVPLLQQPAPQVPLPGWPHAPVQTAPAHVGVWPPHETQAAPPVPVPQVLLLWSSGMTQLPSLQQPVGHDLASQTQAPPTHSCPGGQAGLQLEPLPPDPDGLLSPQPAVASARLKATSAKANRAFMRSPVEGWPSVESDGRFAASVTDCFVKGQPGVKLQRNFWRPASARRSAASRAVGRWAMVTAP